MTGIHRDAWIDNVLAKVKEAQAACHILITKEVPEGKTASNFRAECLGQLNEILRNLCLMFGESLRPPQIEAFRTAAQHFFNSRKNPGAFDSLMRASANLEKIVKAETHLISFHEIFESYKADGELSQLLEQLVTLLEKIINEGDGELTARILKDLQRLLDQIKSQNGLSLSELGAMTEVIGRILLELAGQQVGMPAGSMLMDAAKIAWRARQRVIHLFQEGQNEYVRLLEIKSVVPGLSQLPELDETTIEAIEAKSITDGE